MQNVFGSKTTDTVHEMTSNNRLQILIVDDTLVYRKIVSDIVSELPDVEVVGTAHNGKVAISRIASLKPDLLTLDIEMPEMNGLEVLEVMRQDFPDVGAIVLSTLTQKGGEMTMRALELGAFDFIPKPQAGTMDENRKAVQNTLTPMLRAFINRKEIRGILAGKLTTSAVPVSHKKKEISSNVAQRMGAIANLRKVKSEIVGIGVSTGGPRALSQFIPKLPPDLGVPILIVQHMPPFFTHSLAQSLDDKSVIKVKEGIDGEPVVPNVAFIAQGGKHMKVVAGADGKTRIIRITDDPPENNCKPSVDYLFRSISQLYVGRATGVIMTGMGFDGTLGLKLMKRNGSTIIAQDEATSVVYGMPKGAIDAGIVDIITPLDHIAEMICRTVQ